MRKLNINGSFTTDTFKILSEQRQCYKDLYSCRNNTNDNSPKTESFFKDLNIPKLSEERKISCEGRSTLEECTLILESFQNIKTPGNGGIPIEFYKKFWSLLASILFNEKGEMSHSQIQALITLIEKKGKDRSLLENWRPIFLVNVDAKNMSQVIATRIKRRSTQNYSS